MQTAEAQTASVLNSGSCKYSTELMIVHMESIYVENLCIFFCASEQILSSNDCTLLQQDLNQIKF